MDALAAELEATVAPPPQLSDLTKKIVEVVRARLAHWKQPLFLNPETQEPATSVYGLVRVFGLQDKTGPWGNFIEALNLHAPEGSTRQ
ncbi:MAG: hypothetical protein JO001_22925 [Alphaproteobacteria bacterium]|nr:hypothetical protein [Alphaproteobacteria bacterium]